METASQIKWKHSTEIWSDFVLSDSFNMETASISVVEISPWEYVISLVLLADFHGLIFHSSTLFELSTMSFKELIAL